MNEVCLIWKIIHESYLQGVERNRKQGKIEMVEVEKKELMRDRSTGWPGVAGQHKQNSISVSMLFCSALLFSVLIVLSFIVSFP